jgi:hypothetical protein
MCGEDLRRVVNWRRIIKKKVSQIKFQRLGVIFFMITTKTNGLSCSNRLLFEINEDSMILCEAPGILIC